MAFLSSWNWPRGFPPFLEIEVGTVVDGLHGHLLPAFSCEEDERYVVSFGLQGLEDVQAVHSWHLVIGNDHIELRAVDEQ
jgi:hypothetical protein